MWSIVIAGLAASSPDGGEAAVHRAKIAVLDTQDVAGSQAPTAKLVTQIIGGEVAKVTSIDVITSDQISQMLGYERQKQLLGCNEGGSCLAEIGGALGADYLLTSQLGRLGKRYRLDLQLLDGSKARSVASEGDFLPADDDALADGVVSMSRALLTKAGLTPPAGSFAAASAAPNVVQTVPPRATAGPNHTSAWVVFGVGAALLVGAAAMTFATSQDFNQAVGEFKAGQTNTSSQANLAWMGPLADGLWAGTAVAGGVGTFLYFTAAPAGSGGEVGMTGHF